MIARRLLVRGRVQGVFFRAWTRDQARDLGIAGWVRNLRSGEVEMLLAGPGETVERMISLVRRGPPAAEISEVVVADAGPGEGRTEGGGFEILPTA